MVVVKAWFRECEAAGHTSLTDRKQRGENSGAQPSSLLPSSCPHRVTEWNPQSGGSLS